MAGCTDNRFEKMLYAYELGMLSDEDRTAIEMHHLECDYCFEKAKKFNKSAQLIQCDSSVRDTIHQITESETSEKKENKSIAEKNSWPIWIRSSLAVAAVLVILILQPWKIEISPRQDLIAAENLLIVMPFSTLVDADNSQKFGEIMANLIMTDLSESQELQVVSNRHLFDITKRLGIEDSKIYDNDLTLKIAQEINAKWVITGDILQTEPFFIVTSRIIEIATGNIITTQKISGENTTSVFSLADSLSVLINNDIPVESGILQTSNRMVADVTTHSQDAYRCYLEGVDYSNRAYFAEAVERFEKAIEYDSTFAMAYYYLSNLKDYKLIQKAVEYSEHSTQMEKYFINAKFAIRSRDAIKAIEILQELIDNYPYEKDAYYQIGILKYRLGQFDETIDYMNQVIELDPLFTSGYNILSYSFGKIGQLDKAIEASDKFIFLSPNEPNPYDSRGDIYAMFKMYDEAIESYKKALEKKDDFYASWSSLGNVYTFTGDFIKAERCFKVIASVEDIYVWTNGKILFGHNLMYQGKFAEALTMLEIGSNEDKKAHGEKRYATYHNMPALMYEELGDFDKALDELEKADTISQNNASYSTYWRRYKTRIVANSGNINWALSNADTLKTGLEEAGLELGEYWYSLGTVELAQNNFTKADGYFRKAISEISTYDYSSNYMLGLTLYNLDRLDESIAQFEGLLAAQDSLPATWNSWDARVYYYLGILYDNTGQLDNAAKNYRKYIDIRKDADVELETVIDARKRLNSLIS